jgi:hypothetical protein
MTDMVCRMILLKRLISKSPPLYIDKSPDKKNRFFETLLDVYRTPNLHQSLPFNPEIASYESYYNQYYKTEPLDQMSDEKLLQILFSFPLSRSKYIHRIKEQFIKKDDTDLRFTIDSWNTGITKKNGVINCIKNELYNAYKYNGGITQIITVPDILLREITFTGSISNLSEMLAIGGINYKQVTGYLLFEQWVKKQNRWKGENVQTPTIVVQLDFLIGDWFGVDEYDVTNNKFAAIFARRQMAAFWVLQHQRGYPPIRCWYDYTEFLNLQFDITEDF